MKKTILTLVLALTASLGFAQRFTDKIDRGLVAVPSGSGNLVSWRVLGEEYYDVTYNLYCNGSLLVGGLEVSNYLHSAGTATSKYYVIPVVKGVERPELKSEEVTRWENGYFDILVKGIIGRDGTDVTSHYSLNDVSLGDLDGDGVVEFIVKRPCDAVLNTSQKNCFHVLDCYKLDGTRLWWIDLGPNMISGPDEQWDCVAYDWDMDGAAEVILRIQDNAIIHYADGTTELIGSSTVDTRNTVNTGDANLAYTNTGNEYLLYLEGQTGKPYEIGPPSHPHYMDYPIPRVNASEWGDGYGHRSTKHYFGAPYLDGRRPYMFFGRGAYTQHKFATYEVNPDTHQLTLNWYWENTTGSDSPWYGNGFHNFAIGDVDWDGRDEIIFGSMIIDDNGKGLCTTGNGHGDAQHCSDFDPYRHGGEQFTCNEDEPACTYYNATTGEIYYRYKASGDDGRALCGNFSNNFPGSMGRTLNTGLISTVADKEITSGAPSTSNDKMDGLHWSHLNQRIYWDGDLLDEVFDSPGSNARPGMIFKPDAGRLFEATGSNTNNSSKNNAGAIADIFGDWREELVMRAGDTKLRIYTTNIPTSYRIPTLWSDHQYRNAIVWQSMGYNQPPHKSYFLGDLEGITQAPPTNTTTGRTEVKNGGTITTTDDHLLVCDFNDKQKEITVNIADGATPYIVTFNVPSWVQGNAGSNIFTTPAPTYEYFTCNVTGGALTGSTRLVKQGDGILSLPKVNMAYTGETDIWAGTLNFDGTLKQSPLWLNRFAELNSNGGEFQSVKADYASIIRPGGADVQGNITIDETYTMGFGSRLILDLYSNGFQADQVNAKTLKIEKKTGTVWEQYGPQYLRPVIEVKEHFADGATTLAEGSYIIGKVEELEGSLADIKVEGITDLKYGLSLDDDNNLLLTVGSMRGAAEIVWKGSTNNTWDFAKTENFYLLDDAEQTPDIFVKGDIVNFNSEGSKATVSITDEVSPDSIKVSGTKAYTFSGTGSIVSGALVKEGTARLTIKTDNAYKGGNFLKGGTVLVSSLANENKATGNLGAVTTSPAKFTMENGAVIQTSATVTNGSPIRLKGTEGGVILANADKDFIQNKAFSGTILNKKGTGYLKTYVTGASLNKLIITNGRVISYDGIPAKAIEFQGGALEDATGNGVHYPSTGTTMPLTVPAGKTGTFILGGGYYTAYNNKVTGEGTLTIEPTNTVSRVRITGDWSQFTGTIKHTTKNIWLPLDNSTGIPKGTLDIASGCTVANTKDKTFTIGKLTGAGNLSHAACDFTSSTSIHDSQTTWQVGNSWEDGDFTFDGGITDNGNNNKCNFYKIGNCKMTATGQWMHSGITKVNAGELCFEAGATLGKGALTVASGATLRGTTKNGSTNTPLTNSAYTIDGTLQPGADATASTAASIIDFGGKNVTFNGTSTYRVGLRKAKISYYSDTYTYANASLTNIGTLTFNSGATIEAFLNPEVADLVSDEETTVCFTLWTSANTVTLPSDITQLNLVLPELPPYNYWDTSEIAEGKLYARFDAEKYQEIVTNIDAISPNEMVTAEVVNSSGVTVAEFTCPKSSLKTTFNQTTLPKGVYLLRVKSDKGQKGTMKLMK